MKETTKGDVVVCGVMLCVHKPCQLCHVSLTLFKAFRHLVLHNPLQHHRSYCNVKYGQESKKVRIDTNFVFLFFSSIRDVSAGMQRVSMRHECSIVSIYTSPKHTVVGQMHKYIMPFQSLSHTHHIYIA